MTTLPGIKVAHHRLCPCCGRPIAYVSTSGLGAWYHIGPREQVGDGPCGSLYPKGSPNHQGWIRLLIFEVRLKVFADARRQERRARLRWHRDRPLVRAMRIPGLPLPELVTVTKCEWLVREIKAEQLEDETMRLRRAKHELKLQVEGLQEQVDELQGEMAEMVER